MLDLELFKSGLVRNGNYLYTQDLLALDSHRPLRDSSTSGAQYDSPLVWERWAQLLEHHPDRRFVEYILTGIRQGFCIGFNRDQRLRNATCNLPSQVPAVISEYLAREVSLNRMLKIPLGIWPRDIHISPLGVIPKKNKPGKWRLIVDLSSPADFSINSGICPERSSLSYTSVDHLASMILAEGQGSFMVKADIKEAYRMVPVHPQDQLLLGVMWQDSVYIDKVLPFGLRLAPKIFSAVADAIQWILHLNGVDNIIHYLDDYVLVAKDREQADYQKAQLISTFTELGVPLEPSKLKGPSQCLSFLGIEVDSVARQLHLPQEKMKLLKEKLRSCIDSRSLTKRELQSLVGLLQFATKVVKPGRPFLRRLYTMQQIGKSPSHHIRLNVPARADILWWYFFMDRWNGISILWSLHRQSADLSVFSDASGSWGCGAFVSTHWFALKWCSRLQPLPIAVKELIPVVIAAAFWGNHWSGKIVLFRVDNMAVVEAINASFCKDAHLMHLIRLLVFFAAYYSFWFYAEHVTGKDNNLADALSRNNISLFLSQAPSPSLQQSTIHPSLITLVAQNLTWTSTSWMTLFDATLQQL